MIEGERWCSRANHYVREDQFRILKNGKRSSWCRCCHRDCAREYRARMLSTPESAAAFRERNKRNGNNWAKNNLDKKRRSSREQKARLRAQGISDREYTKAWRKANPDKVRKYHQTYMAKVMSDPERHAAYLESRRLQYRMQKERQGKTVRTVRARKPAKELQMRVPVEPLQSFLVALSKEHGLSHTEIGRATGIHSDQIRHIMKAKYQRVVISTVDKCLTTYDGPPLRSLYPDV